MDEKLRRHWAACEAMVIGRGGISAVARATGLSRNTIRKGIREIHEGIPVLADEIRQRVRRPGGGRRALSEKDPTLRIDLETLLASNTPCRKAPLSWCCKSTRAIAEELQAKGHVVSHVTVSRMLLAMGYSLQPNRKLKDGNRYVDPDAQFRFLARKVKTFQRRRQPVIFVEVRKKEPAREGEDACAFLEDGPEPAHADNLPCDRPGAAAPENADERIPNEGWSVVSISQDTAELSGAAVDRWWFSIGKHLYPQAGELLIAADLGSGSGERTRRWQCALQQLANEAGLKITVCHFPRGTTRWNQIEHRMSWFLTENWRTRAVVSRAVTVNLIGAAACEFTISPEETEGVIPESRIELPERAIHGLKLRKSTFHGDRNYTIRPHA
jgi:hypothetical protein